MQFFILEGIVENYNVRPVFCQGLASLYTVFIDGNADARELSLDLQRFVTRKSCGAASQHILEPFAFTLVPA